MPEARKPEARRARPCSSRTSGAITYRSRALWQASDVNTTRNLPALMATLRQRIRGFVMRSVATPETRPGLVRLGSDYGGWVVPLDLLPPGAVCFTGGVGEDTTFDAALVDRGCVVHAFDPTPRAIRHVEGVRLGDRFSFHPVGLWSEATQLRFFAPRDPTHVSHSIVNLQETDEYFTAEVTTIRLAMDRLGYQTLDLLKLDIEGAQFAVLAAMRRDGVRPGVLCVEFDQPAALWEMVGEIRALRRYGYDLVARDDWNFTFITGDD